MRVNVICRNPNDDRVIPRFARYLADGLGWTVTASPVRGPFDAVYLSGYFESQVCKKWPAAPVAAYLTHREEQPPGNSKAKLFDEIAKRANLRIVTAPMYQALVEVHGPTLLAPAPVERDRFTIPDRSTGRNLVAGFSGYTYRNRRKGEDLVKALLSSQAAKGGVEWLASGRGWPVKTVRYAWRDMPTFYQGLDVLVVPSRVEGVPLPPLEALSCGVSVVIPRGVGMLDDLPDLPGIFRYKRGDARGMIKAFGKAKASRGDVDREALRAATRPYNVEAWVDAHEQAFYETFGTVDAGLAEAEAEPAPVEIVEEQEPVKTYDTSSVRGIYVVAFGDPARKCARRLMTSIKKHMPEIPIALCASRKIGGEDVLIVQPDSDVGGRRAKLRAYQLAPAEWESVLYLDADTEVVGDIRFFFELIEDGWEFVIAKDPHLMDTMHSFRRRYNLKELEETERKLFTLHTLQYNGGVWAFGRNKRIAKFFGRWLAEWERHAQRDQGALIRAMYTEPLKVYLLGNEWNTFPKYTKGIETAGLMHYPGDARRWRGQIRGRIDSTAAWEAVKQFEDRQRGSVRRPHRRYGHQRHGGRR